MTEPALSQLLRRAVVKYLCPKCGSVFDEEIVLNKCFGYGPGEDCDVCPHYDCCDTEADEIHYGRKKEVKPDKNDPPLGTFPDDTPCPQCNTRCILHSHGDIGIECPHCGWHKTVEQCIKEKKKL